ncbi:CobW family GTP-binding protein [Halomonas dongshanensis]|uniref:GTP-binding protein n=1 Tax=Halomonas dongshanensis TaxID=2890835 RepID=A0ABT2EDA0_9GAMM|nr:CobW family GTP-binding protein [Halomonas dongshanensis]MCS2609566.1 GTP-binding protein [Halomonas dongshanensis]
MAKTIAVTLIAGYLGVGKTTWLNAHLRNGVASGTLVLVNDFGAINVDAELIDYQGDRLLKLSSGCLCCSLSDELGTQLSRIARWSEPPTQVLIETSGVARPTRIADLIRVARQYHLTRIVTLIDLASLATRLADRRVGDLIVEQIAAASELSCNRGDTLDHSVQQQLQERLAALNPGASRSWETSSGGERELGSVLEDLHASRPRPRFRSVYRPAGPDPAWKRFAITLSATLKRQELEALLTAHADGIARAKGFLQADGRHYVFQWSGDKAYWTPSSPRPGNGQLVGIGFDGVTFEALVAALEALSTR